MEKCPACGGQVGPQGATCQQCDADLSAVVAAQLAATRQRHLALAAITQGDTRSAYEHALRACQLHRTADGSGLLVLAMISNGDFEKAYSVLVKLSRRSKRPARRAATN